MNDQPTIASLKLDLAASRRAVLAAERRATLLERIIQDILAGRFKLKVER